MSHCVVLLIALAIGASSAEGQKPKDDVLTAGQAVFDAMAKRDTAALARLLHPAAHLIATVESGDSVSVRVTTRDAFMTMMAGANAIPRERMWNSEVRVSGPIATIWTPYDFHLGTQFSHCGIDSFQLVKGKEGWLVTSLIYTVVRPADRCKPSPLGPVR